MRIKITRVLPLFLVLTLAFAAGCLVPVADVDPAVEEPRVEIALTPEELVERMAEAMRALESLKAEAEMAMEMKTVIYGETVEMSSSTRSASQVDIINQRMKTTTILETTMPPMPRVPEEFMEMEMEMEMYWVDGVAYMKVSPMPGMPPMWTKIEVPWMCFFGPSIDLLKASRVEILGVEVVNGIETYVIEVVPDLGKFWELMAQHMMLGPEMAPDPALMDKDFEEMFEKANLKSWVCRDTFLTVKDQIQTTMVLEFMGEKQRVEMSGITRFHSFNEPVSIQLPPEAAEAMEIPEW